MRRFILLMLERLIGLMGRARRPRSRRETPQPPKDSYPLW